jgi:hypothetical protein
MRKVAIFATLGFVVMVALASVSSTLATLMTTTGPSLSSSVLSVDYMTRTARHLPADEVADRM